MALFDRVLLIVSARRPVSRIQGDMGGDGCADQLSGGLGLLARPRCCEVYAGSKPQLINLFVRQFFHALAPATIGTTLDFRFVTASSMRCCAIACSARVSAPASLVASMRQQRVCPLAKMVSAPS